jgi:hypothetical protein
MALHPPPGDLPANHKDIHLHPEVLVHDRLAVCLTPAFGLPPTEPLGCSLDHILAIAVDDDRKVLRHRLKSLDSCRHFHLVVGRGAISANDNLLFTRDGDDSCVSAWARVPEASSVRKDDGLIGPMDFSIGS